MPVRGVHKSVVPELAATAENKENYSSGQHNALDEIIAELAKANAPNVQNVRRFGKIVQTQNREDLQDPWCVSSMRSSSQTLQYDNENYKNALLSQLCVLLRVDSLKGILDYDFSGADVRWNCEHTGPKGIVRVPPDQDYLTNHLITMMRYLSRWPFEAQFSEPARVPYEGFELNVFKSVCEQFDKDCPMIPSCIALSVLHIVRLFRRRIFFRKSPPKMQKETVFGTSSSPVTRYVPKPTTALLQTRNRKDGLPSSSASAQFSREADHATSPHNATRSTEPLFLAGRMAYEAVLSRLPGLQRSPELMERIEELALANTLMPRSSTPRLSDSSQLLAGQCCNECIGSDDEKLLKKAIALVMLTLEPRVRRRLHYLLRFMLRVSRNHCLRMDQQQDNRTLVLGSLADKIVGPLDGVSASDCRQLVIFLMDNESDVFTVPGTLISEMKSLQREVSNLVFFHIILRASKNPLIGHQPAVDTQPSSTERIKTHYCEPIQADEYESQKKDVDSHLFALLENILTSESLSAQDKKRRLKQFKNTYPEIYARKFPASEQSKPGLLERLRSFRL
ncbi:unnamed protein product [Gongylonema pulchrum]|uniref:DEP domain-containing protein n=1 Tax=Gongylonema pulchrum TaxID=637853 RepID=A0A183EA62_9BILA|nr:unnamed protein product [Gongylonema pulchrum]